METVIIFFFFSILIEMATGTILEVLCIGPLVQVPLAFLWFWGIFIPFLCSERYRPSWLGGRPGLISRSPQTFSPRKPWNTSLESHKADVNILQPSHILSFITFCRKQLSTPLLTLMCFMPSRLLEVHNRLDCMVSFNRTSLPSSLLLSDLEISPHKAVLTSTQPFSEYAEIQICMTEWSTVLQMRPRREIVFSLCECERLTYDLCLDNNVIYLIMFGVW